MLNIFRSIMLGLIRNPVYITRLFFVLIATLIGYWVGRGTAQVETLQYSVAGFLFSVFCVIVEVATGVIASKKILMASIGLLCGLVIAWFIYPTLPPALLGTTADESTQKARIICNLVFGYFGVILAIKHANRFSFNRTNLIMSVTDTARILDTSVIVDGRIKQLIEINFLNGSLIVPEFVLDELQRIADSSDAKKRARGRRGLQLLDELKEASPRLAVWEKDYPDIKGVDQKLIALAKDLGSDLITNDYNLQKVAQLHNVRVLNINELSSLLRPPVAVGDHVQITVVKEGTAAMQGVGYLDDGTMVVVEHALEFVGSDIEAVVTSILQQPTGRMVFARLADPVRNGGG